MERHRRSGALAIAGAVVLSACGGGVGGGGPGPPGPVAVDVRPLDAQVTPGGTVAFGAAVTGAADPGLAWEVLEASGCGSVSAAGVYTAPPASATCHVRAASRAAPGATATATVVVTDAFSAAWRPFSPASPWNTPIPANPELAPDSAALIADLVSSSPYGAHLDVNVGPGAYGIPLYFADGATPTYSVFAAYGGQGWTGSSGTNATGTMPIPYGAEPDPHSDHHLLVADLQRGMEWGCWNMARQPGGWRAGACAATDLAGTGVRPPADGTRPWYEGLGARACGFPLVAGLITAEEIQAGRIDHALVIAYPHIRAGWFTPPASTAQGANGIGSISTRGIPCGGRIQFDPGVDVNALPLGRSGRAIVRALQQYGAYVGDFSGALSLSAENAPAAQAYFANGALDMYELAGKIDLNGFRVLRLGVLYDYGNGG